MLADISVNRLINPLTYHRNRAKLFSDKEAGNMSSVISAVKDTVPISLFNKGKAGQVFSDVKKTGAKVVIKNNEPECVLMSPEEYSSLVEKLSDMEFSLIAAERLAKHPNPKDWLSEEDFLKAAGVTQQDIDSTEDVEIE